MNPSNRLASINADIESLQGLIAEVQDDMDKGLTGNSSKDMTALRVEMNKLKAALGEARNSESFWRQETKEAQEARKSTGDIARG